MKAEEKKLLQFFEGSEKNFIIPVYQRNYDWKKEQCKQLFDDIIEVVNSNFRTHFLGTIVAYNEDGYGKELLIIDGQQRLTTISILLLAMYNLLHAKQVFGEYVNEEQIYNEFLINKYSKDQTKKIRLKPIKDDRDAFESIFRGDLIEDSNISINYNYFVERIQKQEISIDDLYKAIEHLVIVEILLKKGEDDPQLIFESLNSTGLELTEADKVRNFILMKQINEKQEEYYDRYWSKIEKNTSYKVSNFIRDYLILKERKIPSFSKIYLAFKEYVRKHNLATEYILSDLLKYSYYYEKIIKAKDDNKEISSILNNINNLEVMVMYPYLLELYEDKDNGIISEQDFIRILNLLESFVFRRFICNVPTSSLNKIFMLLGKEIKNQVNYEENYFEIFKYVLLSKTGSQRFPNDAEFSKNLKNKDIYNTQSKNKLHLLKRLESFGNRESYVASLIEDGVLTVEHIMPKTLTLEWEKELGENAKQIHENYLDTLGNITLTGYNSKYSNRSFEEKKTVEKGFNESPLYLNNYIKNCVTWGESQILERANILKDKALQIWGYPTTNYEIPRDISKTFTLDDEGSFIGQKIIGFKFKDNEYDVANWSDFFQRVVKILYDKDPVLINSFKNEDRLSCCFFDTDKELYTCRKITTNLYLNVGMNTNRKLYILRMIFDRFNIDLNELEFYFK